VKLYTSFWANRELADVDAQIVSISRGEPRWRLPFAYRRLRELAPGDEAWRQKGRESFEETYRAQLEEIGAAAILERLERIGGARPVVMLCWEKPGEFCHRRVLADFLRARAGVELPELAPGDLPQRQDAAEPRLF
jgi:uncharacterized protein (DUF488 family)